MQASRQGHVRFASQLRALIEQAKETAPQRRTDKPGAPRAIPIVQPQGELAGLLTASYPDTSFVEMSLSDDVRARLDRVLREQRNRERLRAHGLAPQRRLLLVGPPGTGKTMSASGLAGELRCHLFAIRLDGLITRYLGETAAKLRMVFDAIQETRSVHLFDEFDALGGERSTRNEVGEIRRVLNSFLQFLENDESDSLVVAATNHPQLLDRALFRRFDAVIEHSLPAAELAEQVLRARLGILDTSAVDWPRLAEAAGGLCHADLARAADHAAKDAILEQREGVRTEDAMRAFGEQRAAPDWPEPASLLTFSVSPSPKRTPMNKHTLALLGGPADSLRIPADLLRDAIGLLIEGAQQATRYAIEGESSRRGIRPAWLDAATHFEITGLTAGSTVLDLEAPTLREATVDHPELFEALALAEPLEPTTLDRTAVELFGDVLASVIERTDAEVLADRRLLETCGRFARLTSRGTAGIRLDGLRGRSMPLILRESDAERFDALRDDTPDPQAVRLTGTLETISASSWNLVLALTDGTKVPARLSRPYEELLRRHFNERVVISGRARYRLSGKLQLVEVDAMETATDRDSLIEKLPPPRTSRPLAARVAQDAESGVAAFFGTWPGDESDADLLRALEAIE